MKFNAGQFINIQVADQTFRSYSICSDNAITDEVSIIASIAHEGVGSNYLKSLKVGDSVTFIGPSGNFKLKEPLPKSLIFFATGTGIAPFISMFYALKNQGFLGKIEINFGVRTEADFLFTDVLAQFNVNYYVSQPANPGITPQRVTARFDTPLDLSAHYYLCGHPNMIEEVSQKLLALNVPEEAIIFEKFTKSTV